MYRVQNVSNIFCKFEGFLVSELIKLPVLSGTPRAVLYLIFTGFSKSENSVGVLKPTIFQKFRKRTSTFHNTSTLREGEKKIISLF